MKARRGLTIVESLFSVLLVGTLVVVSLDAVGASTAAQRAVGDHGRGHLFAGDLLSEIMQQAYSEPVQTTGWGTESLETATTRLAFDDVDDYVQLSESQLRTKDGTLAPASAGWQRTVEVVFLCPDDLTKTETTDYGVKRVTVTAKYNGKVMAVLTGIKTGKAVFTGTTPVPDPNPSPSEEPRFTIEEN
jgi:hypothetical protein